MKLTKLLLAQPSSVTGCLPTSSIEVGKDGVLELTLYEAAGLVKLRLHDRLAWIPTSAIQVMMGEDTPDLVMEPPQALASARGRGKR
jgi:hypothetical protein